MQHPDNILNKYLPWWEPLGSHQGCCTNPEPEFNLRLNANQRALQVMPQVLHSYFITDLWTTFSHCWHPQIGKWGAQLIRQCWTEASDMQLKTSHCLLCRCWPLVIPDSGFFMWVGGWAGTKRNRLLKFLKTFSFFFNLITPADLNDWIAIHMNAHVTLSACLNRHHSIQVVLLAMYLQVTRQLRWFMTTTYIVQEKQVDGNTTTFLFVYFQWKSKRM